MDVCNVEYCAKQANLDGLCLFHRRKDLAGQLEYADGVIYDTCSKGHRWTPANTHWEASSKGGTRRRCKKCLALRAAKRREEDPVVEAPTSVSLPTPVHRRAHAVADGAMAGLAAKCKGKPGPYTDYTGNTMPTDAEAAKLCSGCPLIEPCGLKAATERPDWGIWGGQVWLYGEPYNGDRSRLDADD